jgi:hypothetical protein
MDTSIPDRVKDNNIFCDGNAQSMVLGGLTLAEQLCACKSLKEDSKTRKGKERLLFRIAYYETILCSVTPASVG